MVASHVKADAILPEAVESFPFSDNSMTNDYHALCNLYVIVGLFLKFLLNSFFSSCIIGFSGNGQTLQM